MRVACDCTRARVLLVFRPNSLISLTTASLISCQIDGSQLTSFELLMVFSYHKVTFHYPHRHQMLGFIAFTPSYAGCQSQRSAPLRLSRSSTSDRQRPNTDSLFIKNNNAALLQRVRDIWQVSKQQRYLLFRASLRHAPQKNYRWLGFRSQREQSAKIGIRRDDYSVFVRGEREDRLVLRRRHSVIADMACLMSGLPQSFSH